MATQGLSTKRWLIGVAVLDVVLFTLGVLIATGHIFRGLTANSAGREWLSIAVGCMAIVSFFGLLLARYESRTGGIGEASLRFAVAASLIIVYLAVVASSAFYGPVGQPQELHPLTREMITSFTAVIGIVVAFFFGSSAYLEGKKNQKDDLQQQ